MVASATEILPDNPLELTEKVIMFCCPGQILLIGRASPTRLFLKCGKCGTSAEATEVRPKNMRSSKSFLKNRKRIRRAMKASMEDLIGRFNFRVITGTDDNT